MDFAKPSVRRLFAEFALQQTIPVEEEDGTIINIPEESKLNGMIYYTFSMNVIAEITLSPTMSLRDRLELAGCVFRFFAQWGSWAQRALSGKARKYLWITPTLWESIGLHCLGLVYRIILWKAQYNEFPLWLGEDGSQVLESLFREFREQRGPNSDSVALLEFLQTVSSQFVL